MQISSNRYGWLAAISSLVLFFTLCCSPALAAPPPLRATTAPSQENQLSLQPSPTPTSTTTPSPTPPALQPAPTSARTTTPVPTSTDPTPSSGDSKEHEARLAIQLKWVDFWIALPGVLASILLGWWSRKLSSSEGNQGLSSILSTITRGFAVLALVVFLSLLGVFWIAAKRTTLPFDYNAVRNDLRSVVQRELASRLDRLESNMNTTTRKFLRENVLPEVRSGVNRHLVEIRRLSPNVAAENAALKMQLGLSREENARLWQILLNNPDFLRSSTFRGGVGLETRPSNPSWLLWALTALSVFSVIYIIFLHRHLRAASERIWRLDREIRGR